MTPSGQRDPTRRPGADTRDHTDPHPTLPSTDLVGHLSGDELLPRAGDAAAERRMVEELAGTLGIDAVDIDGIPPRQAAIALRRVRGLLARAADLEARAIIDDLTGVLRRGAGMTALGEEMARARRLDVGLVVAFLDVDGLKRVNDTLGHPAGDAALRAVAATLRRGLRSYDVVARFGGDEFVCVLLGADLRGAERLLREVRSAIAEATRGITVSVGLAAAAAEDDPASLVARADRALLAARHEQRSGAKAAPSGS